MADSKRVREFKLRIKKIVERQEKKTREIEKAIQENGGSPVVFENGTSWMINGNELSFTQAFGKDAVID